MSDQKPKQASFPQTKQLKFPVNRSRVRRIGCVLMTIVWFIVLLTPCFCITLATQGEIAIRVGNIPGNSYRIWLVNESRQRGLGISRPSLVTEAENSRQCIQTDVSFILWMGSQEATSYCECYTPGVGTSEWELASSQSGACQPR